jgi:hypothetical protein
LKHTETTSAVTTIKLKSIADITETEHFIFDTEDQCVAYSEEWEAQTRLARAG